MSKENQEVAAIRQKMLYLYVSPPDGFEFVSTIPRSYMHDESCLLVRYDIKRTEQEDDTYAELKAQYALDVERCKKIEGLESWDLWQFKNKTAHSWNRAGGGEPAFLIQNKYRRRHHADNIIAYYLCSDEDKKRWQFRGRNGEWFKTDDIPMWMEDREYRLPPKPFFIGKHEVPPPVTEPLENGQEYWSFNTLGAYISMWNGYPTDFLRLKKGLIRLTEYEAKLCFEALQNTLKGN